MNEQHDVGVKWQSAHHKLELQRIVEKDPLEQVGVRSFFGSRVSTTRLESSALRHFAMIQSRVRTRQSRIWPLQNSKELSHAGHPKVTWLDFW